MKISPEIIENHGLSKNEYTKILKLLKRTPNIVELGIFSAMWNEHCSYKSSKLHLKKLLGLNDPDNIENLKKDPYLELN